MKKYGIFYGSLTGTTKHVAEKIAKELGVDSSDIHNVSDTAPDVLGEYEIIVAGTSTWGDGEIESDWYDFLDGAQAMDLSAQRLAVFGTGDETMVNTFCNGVHYLVERFAPTKATLIGQFPATAYTFAHSEAVDTEGVAEGLLLDEVNHADLSDARISEWTTMLKK